MDKKVLSVRTTKVVDHDEHLLGKGKYPIQYAKADDKSSSVSIRYKRYLDIIYNLPSMLALMINSERMSEEQSDSFWKVQHFPPTSIVKKPIISIYLISQAGRNCLQMIKLVIVLRTVYFSCSSIATCPQTVKPVSVPSEESESRKIADLVKKVSQTLCTSLNGDVDFIFRHNVFLRLWEATVRLQLYKSKWKLKEIRKGPRSNF